MIENSDPDNIVVRTAEQLFPQWQEDIRRLRHSNPTFSEICSDFELLAGMVREDHPADADVNECLEGLKDEIRGALYARHDVA